MSKEKTTQNLGVAIPIEMHRALMEIAAKNDLKLSQIVRIALKELIKTESNKEEA